ncbi:hypothetical protein SAMN05421796_101775 [Chryseobacterium piscicola]|uniref:Uncharacterized protein n=1 Tax=Chryseobacterium piscicola TaxID=551459 RepID=A0A1N7KS38_9FLAO|nr:hypothetical protein [Chryseobacterium piscicola]PQA94977.1 hypothetical protein B0A70_06560 [Chryseobacterium piscicola]SIS64260.1 hypothetical protein SAMN05421796_101775 [Chryseobacterium piscicola]
MKKSLQKFKVKKLDIKHLELFKGGKLADGSSCGGTAETNTVGADSDSDGSGGSADQDTGTVYL